MISPECMRLAWQALERSILYVCASQRRKLVFVAKAAVALASTRK